MTVKGPGNDKSDGSESTRERPWTLSIAGRWTSIMMVKRRKKDGGGGRGRGLRGRTWSPRSPITIQVRSAFAVPPLRSQIH